MPRPSDFSAPAFLLPFSSSVVGLNMPARLGLRVFRAAVDKARLGLLLLGPLAELPASASRSRKSDHSSARLSRPADVPPGDSSGKSLANAGVDGVRRKGESGARRLPVDPAPELPTPLLPALPLSRLVRPETPVGCRTRPACCAPRKACSPMPSVRASR